MKECKRNLLTGLLAAAFILTGFGSVLAGEYSKQKVVYHFNSNDFKTIGGGLRNIQNHINAVGADKLDIIVVVHGAGHVMFRKDKSNEQIFSKIKSLKMQGVKFGLCSVTVSKKKLDLDKDLEMISVEELVPSGVAELAKLQQEGYAYIKP
jgi:intracellular sulfur oxidation DsrE/DsrF family protein